MEYKGIDYFRKKLAKKTRRVELRYKYYEMKNITKDFDISTPPKLRNVMSCLGWCSKSVDALADRLSFREFQNDNYEMNEIFEANNPDILFDSAIVNALIGSCSFIYISNDENGSPRLQVLNAYDATGELDPFTNMLTEGYAVLSRDANNKPIEEAYFTPGRTDYYLNGEFEGSYEYNAPYPLLVPVIFKPDAKRNFGHSRISRACMSIQDSAVRTIKRSEISAEFFSYPQKWATGVSEDAEMDKWKATMSSLLMFTKDEDGEKPTIGQFQQQSMAPHIDQLRMFAAAFAGETGLTLDDLGFVTDNPSSAEAIKSAHENLRLIARKAQKTFGSAFINVGYLSACVRDNMAYTREEAIKTKTKWEPVFEPDASTLSLIGDGLIKINQTIPGYLNKENLRDLTGIVPGEDNE